MWRRWGPLANQRAHPTQHNATRLWPNSIPTPTSTATKRNPTDPAPSHPIPPHPHPYHLRARQWVPFVFSPKTPFFWFFQNVPSFFRFPFFWRREKNDGNSFDCNCSPELKAAAFQKTSCCRAAKNLFRKKRGRVQRRFAEAIWCAKKKNDLSKCTILRPKTRLVIASTTRNQKTWESTVPLSFLHLSVSLPFLLLHLRITRGKTECSNRIASSCCLPPLSVALCFSRNNAPTKFTSFSGRGALFCGCGTRKSLIPFAENCVLAEVTLFLCEVAFSYRLNKFFPFSPSVRSSLLYCSIGKHCGAM